jgi:hypothetical protein
MLVIHKLRGKFRLIVKATGNLARAKAGKGHPIDGGGFKSKAKAARQIQHIISYKASTKP